MNTETRPQTHLRSPPPQPLTDRPPPHLLTDQPTSDCSPHLRDTGQREALRPGPDSLGGEGSVRHRTCLLYQVIGGGLKASRRKGQLRPWGTQAERPTAHEGTCRCPHPALTLRGRYLRSHSQSKENTREATDAYFLHFPLFPKGQSDFIFRKSKARG